jgi:hypothetical protein
LYSSIGKDRQDGDQLSPGSIEPEIWSLGLNGPDLTGHKNLVAHAHTMIMQMYLRVKFYYSMATNFLDLEWFDFSFKMDMRPKCIYCHLC